MLEIFSNVFSSSTDETLGVGLFLLCLATAFAEGFIYLAALSIKQKFSASFKFSALFLPVVVCVVIMAVNGNIGVGVAIAGAFSLVRFRSAQGSAKEICIIFATMCSGLIAGVGYLAYSLLFTVIIAAAFLVFSCVATKKGEGSRARILKITVPEDLDYPQAFDEVFSAFAEDKELLQVKTTNMGSLFKLTYRVDLKKDVSEKEFLDKLRVRNGNLEILLSKEDTENAL